MTAEVETQPWCDFGDLPADQCGHCRGITTVDVDSARVPDLEPAPAIVVHHRPRQYGKVKLDKLGRILTQTAAVYDQLADALHGTRGAGSGDRVTGSGGDDKPMPLQHQVAEHRHLLVRGLRFWAARMRDMDDATEPLQTVPRLVAFIISRMAEGAVEDHWSDELTANMLDWQRRARVLTDLPTLRGTIPLGPKTCPNRTQTLADLPDGDILVAALGDIEPLWQCGGQLQVLLPADKGAPTVLRCMDCGGRWDVADLPEAANVRLSIADAAALTHTSVRTLQYRVQHGSLPARAGFVLLGDVLRSGCAL